MLLSSRFLLSLALLQGALVHSWSSMTTATVQTYNTSRIELDPDPSTVVGNCPTDFSTLLTTMVSNWFVDAVASERGSYPSVSNPGKMFDNYVFRKSSISNRQLRGGGDNNDQQDRSLCSSSSCTNCCPSYCNTYCGGSGGCRRCGGRRLAEDRWWWGDSSYQNNIASSIRFAAQRWLNQNDPTRCMGNPWALNVSVNFF